MHNVFCLQQICVEKCLKIKGKYIYKKWKQALIQEKLYNNKINRDKNL